MLSTCSASELQHQPPLNLLVPQCPHLSNSTKRPRNVPRGTEITSVSHSANTTQKKRPLVPSFLLSHEPFRAAVGQTHWVSAKGTSFGGHLAESTGKGEDRARNSEGLSNPLSHFPSGPSHKAQQECPAMH
jgi:hypothetical protein